MVYTVKNLSMLSGVTVRTLHFYEEAGLLQPAYYGANGYRYYGERELLQLQQILFFKELGFTLKQIQKVVGKSDFDQLAALHSHKKALRQEWEKIGVLLQTIDTTINHLQGKKKMKETEMFDGFHIGLVRAKSGCSADEMLVFQSVKNPTQNSNDVARRGKAYYDNITKSAHAIFTELVLCLSKGLDPAAGEVQKIIAKHHAYAEQIHFATQEVYKAMARLYATHPDFRKQLDPFHQDLALFLKEGMILFADRELS